MKTLVIGRNGQLASELRKIADDSFVFAGREMIDLARPEVLAQLVDKVRPVSIINCAAYVQFDLAESHEDECRRLNVDLVEQLATLADRFESHLVHFSTDYVFDGESQKPYAENDIARPLSVYGRTKRDGELCALKAHSSTVIRTSWLYSDSASNFVKRMLELADLEKPLRVVNDQFGNPTWTQELARATLDFFARRSTQGLYHYSGAGIASWFDFASEIMKVWEKSKTVEPISRRDFKTAGERPAFSALDTSKFQRESGLTIRDWRESLRDCHATWGARCKHI